MHRRRGIDSVYPPLRRVLCGDWGAARPMADLDDHIRGSDRQRCDRLPVRHPIDRLHHATHDQPPGPPGLRNYGRSTPHGLLAKRYLPALA